MAYSSVDPELLPALDALKGVWGDTSMNLDELATARQTHDAMAVHSKSIAPLVEGVKTTRRNIVNTKLGVDVVVYIHQPSRVGELADSALLHIHGGGYVMGSATHSEPQLRSWAKQFNCMVVSVEYRLAPEHPFPAALLDCFAALEWLHVEAASLNVDPAKISVLGESAGGGLAAALALYARDHSDIKIAHQILLYPMLDHRNTLEADDDNFETHIWSRKNNQFAWAAYIGASVDDSMMSYASPSYAEKWQGLPPTYLCVGSIDLFYQENCDYAKKLRAAGVSVELDVYPRAYHAFQVVVSGATVSQNCLHKLDAVLSSVLS